MAGGSVEATLELWASSLRDVKERIRPLFLQERMAQSAGLFLDALLGPERRKTGWMRAEAAGDPGPWRQQALLGRAQWDADALRDVVRDYVLETLAAPDAVLVVDETGSSSRGRPRAGSAASTRDQRARSPTARLVCLQPMSRTRAMPSSTGLST